MFIYIWIEGEKNLEEFCMKRFREKPHFVETSGKCGMAGIKLRYKTEEGYGGSHEMYFVYLEVGEKGKYSYFELEDKMTMSYEEIRLDKTAILKR